MAYAGNAWDRRRERFEGDRHYLQGTQRYVDPRLRHHHQPAYDRELPGNNSYRARPYAAYPTVGYIDRLEAEAPQHPVTTYHPLPPAQLVMNFGSLYAQDGHGNRVVYNAPGSNMVLGPGNNTPGGIYGGIGSGTGLHSGYGGSYPSRAAIPTGNLYQDLGTTLPSTTLAATGLGAGMYSTGPLQNCPRCGVRRVILGGGVCRDCELDRSMRAMEIALRVDRLRQLGGLRRDNWG